MQATHRRNIKPGTKYNSLFGKIQGKDPLIDVNASTYDTVAFIQKVIAQHKDQGEALAKELDKGSIKKTSKAVFNFFYNHFQYKPDAPHEEQVRTLYRSWHDRKTGIDCDCFTTAIGQVITHLVPKYIIRKVKLNHKPYYQHIYIIVPKDPNNLAVDPHKNRDNYWVIDPVLDHFDQEAPNITQFNDTIMDGTPLRFLNGTESNLGIALSKKRREQIADALATISKITEREVIQANKDKALYIQLYGSNASKYIEALKKLNGQLKSESFTKQVYISPNVFLAYLAKLDTQITLWVNKDGLDKINREESLGLRAKDVGFIKDIKNTGILEQIQGKASKLASKVWRGIVRGNPLTMVLRLGILKGIEFNLPVRHFIASKLAPAVLSTSQAKTYGFSDAQINRSKGIINDVVKFYADYVGGVESKLKAAILKGFNNSVKTGRVKVKGASTSTPGATAATEPSRPQIIRPNPNRRPQVSTSAKPSFVPMRMNGLGEVASAAIITASAGAIAAIATLVSSLKAQPENISVHSGEGGGTTIPQFSPGESIPGGSVPGGQSLPETEFQDDNTNQSSFGKIATYGLILTALGIGVKTYLDAEKSS